MRLRLCASGVEEDQSAPRPLILEAPRTWLRPRDRHHCDPPTPRHRSSWRHHTRDLPCRWTLAPPASLHVLIARLVVRQRWGSSRLAHHPSRPLRRNSSPQHQQSHHSLRPEVIALPYATQGSAFRLWTRTISSFTMMRTLFSVGGWDGRKGRGSGWRVWRELMEG